jgi:hypothetical protein
MAQIAVGMAQIAVGAIVLQPFLAQWHTGL